MIAILKNIRTETKKNESVQSKAQVWRISCQHGNKTKRLLSVSWAARLDLWSIDEPRWYSQNFNKESADGQQLLPLLLWQAHTDLHSSQWEAGAIWDLNSSQSQTYTNMLPFGKPTYYPREIGLQPRWDSGETVQVEQSHNAPIDEWVALCYDRGEGDTIPHIRKDKISAGITIQFESIESVITSFLIHQSVCHSFIFSCCYVFFPWQSEGSKTYYYTLVSGVNASIWIPLDKSVCWVSLLNIMKGFLIMSESEKRTEPCLFQSRCHLSLKEPEKVSLWVKLNEI